MVLRVLLVVLLCGFSHAALRGQDITQKRDEMRAKLREATKKLKTFSRDDPADEGYIAAQLRVEDLNHRIKLIHFVGLGVMTNAEFETLAEVQYGLSNVQIRHHFVPRGEGVHALKIKHRKLTEQWDELMTPIKKKAHMIENKDKIERLEKIQTLRQQIQKSTDREETALLRLQLEGLYASRPRPTQLALDARERERKADMEVRRRQAEREGRTFFDGRYPTLNDEETAALFAVRKKMGNTNERDEVFALRQEMDKIRQSAVARENKAHHKIVQESRARGY